MTAARTVEIVRRLLPDPLLEVGRRIVGTIRRARAKRRTQRSSRQRRSAAEVFSQVYQENVWGGTPGEYYSGGGSEDSFTGLYRDLVHAVAAQRGRRLTIVDLGCGDFRVGRRLVNSDIDYVGVDVVPSLIQHNQQAFGREGVTFMCLDIVEGDLPEGDLCLIRQVFQHLSNDEIARVLPKLRRYPQILVTEHYFTDDSRIVPNVDKPHGPDTRLDHGSGVYLDRPPFSVHGVEPVLTVPFDRWTELRTFKLDFSAGD